MTLDMIVLTAAQAERVRGLSQDGRAALDPVPLADGTFGLPLAVLADPAHKRHHAALAGRARKAVRDDDRRPPDD